MLPWCCCTTTDDALSHSRVELQPWKGARTHIPCHVRKVTFKFGGRYPGVKIN